ncbi:amino acid adenylation domain-containing protein [Corallococcus exiguus]|uniref:amino acid adenylation domain-containing protein n=2 Tax=Corallococcus exiguus TaxID=83462 RepID=UPI003DA635C1
MGAGLTPRGGTLVELLLGRAETKPDERLYTFLEEDGPDAELTYRGLDARARRIAVALQESTPAGERAVLLYPPGLEYVAGFFGCLYAGVVAVPAYPPDPMRLERTLPRLRAIIQDAQATVVLTTSFVLSMKEALFEFAPDLAALRWVATDELPEGGEAGWRGTQADPESLAFLQYTSGSTGTPRGVMLSHGNLLHNLRLISGAFQVRADSAGVIWLPPYHDMGLIGGILQPLYAGFACTLMSPMTFLKNPFRWLEALSRTRGTISGGPNFAFDLCVRKVSEEQRRQLDLSRWEVAFCGAEPIRAEALDRFAEAFGPSGFRREAFYTCYGLAEGTLIASGATKGHVPVLRTLDRKALELGRAESPSASTEARTLVGCGKSLEDQELRVVHPELREPCPPGVVGEVWVSGQSVARGYWRRPEESEASFQGRLADGRGPFLRTGDLGFLDADGELFVTGRMKDLIILRGRNHYPQDLELTAESSHPALRPGCGAAFAVEVGGQERLVLVQEVDLRRYANLRQQFEAGEVALGAIRQRLAEGHEVRPHAVVLIEPGSLSKTSSGKVQRRATRAAYLEGSLRVVLAWEEEGPPEGGPSGGGASGGPSSGSSSGPSSPPSSGSGGGTARAEGGAGAPSRLEAVEAWLVSRLAARLQLRPESLRLDEPITRHGLDSLAAVELANDVETGLGVALPMEVLLQGPSLSELARRICAKQEGTHRGAPTRTSSEDAVPLSFAQQRLWFLHQLEPGSPLHHIPAAVRLTGELDVAALSGALGALVRRHEALRTTVDERDGVPVQRVLAHLDVTPRVEDLTDVPAARREAEMHRRLREEACRPFDLTHGPLLRALLLRTGEREHVLLLVVHHLVADGWSLGVLVREVGALYAALREGRDATLPALPVRYVDYTVWHREWLKGDVLESQLAWWRKQLAGAPQVLELLGDAPRPPVQSYRGAKRPVRLSAELTRAVRELAVREGVTPFMVLLAAFQAVLHRYSGQEDVCVGTPVAGRTHAELEGMVGVCINTLVLRTRVEGQRSFRELLARVREVTLGAYAHQDVPFELLVQALQPARSRSHAPLFQAMLILQPASAVSPALPGVEARLEDVDTGTAQYDLTLSLHQVQGALEGTLEYSTDLFQASTAARLVSNLETLLTGAVAEPSRAVSQLPLLSEDERRRVLGEWNATRRPYEDAGLAALLEAQAARTPDAVALVCGTERLTYRALHRRANALASRLRAEGVGPEVVVGLCVRRSVELVVGMLGILKAGGAYLPLDPNYPAERLAYMLEDSGARLLLTQASLDGTLGADGVRPVLVDAPDARGEASEHGPGDGAGPEHLAYVLYTSGSTGRPKGVQVVQRNVANFFAGMDERVPVGPRPVWLAVTSVSFDISVLELLWTLARGFQVVVHGDEVGAASVLAEVRQHAVTHLQGTPSLARALLLEPGAEDVLGTLRCLLVGGEALPPALAASLARRLPRRLLNMYGPTETTVWSSTHTVGAAESPVPIGRPLANTELYVLDAHLRPVPGGVAGELYIGGEGVVRGYRGRPELTAERFISDPFSGRPGARLYRTGDLARWKADGTLEFLGRVDFQVKVRGFRIELGEVEAVLARHPGVQAAVVSAREEAPGDRRLVAYAVPRPGHTLDVSSLREHLRRGLPEYMVPSAFVVLAALPLTPNGKVDRKALPAPEGRGLEPRREAFVAPRTPIEERVAGLWARLLQVERVGLHDDFFELGGHSLLAARLVAAVRASFGVEVPLRDVFSAPTVAGLAERLQAAAGGGLASALPPVRPVARGETAPLSFAQQRLWFLDQMEPGNPAYNVPGAVWLDGALDVAALEEALREVLRRHEALRTSFREQEGGPVQVISPVPAGPLLEVVEVQGGDAAALEDEALRRSREEARRPFELTRGPLMRATLLRLGAHEHVLLLTLHHIISDGWSLQVLVREVVQAYGALVEGRAPVLPLLPVQYADHALWQQEWLRGEVLDAQVAWWREQLAGAPPVLDLPTDRPRTAVQGFRGALLPVQLPRDLSGALKSLARAEGVTPFMVLLAGLQVLLSRYSGQQDVSVGTPVAGRHGAEVEELIGVFINTLVLRTKLEAEASFRTLLGQVRETTLGAFAHQQVPFERLVQALQPERRLGYSPLFQVMLILQQDLQAELNLPGLSARLRDVDVGTSRFDFTLSLADTAEGFQGTLEYSTDLFEAATVQRMLGHLHVLLEAAVAAPERKLSEVTLLTEAERQQVLKGWNATEQEYARESSIAEEFERQVAQRPDAVAVECGEEKLTYRQLDEKANQLAHLLRSKGVGAEERVGLCLERSVELVVALVGIAKSGGAYVPLEADYPQARLEQMVSEVKPRVVVTRRALAEKLPVQGMECVLLEEVAEKLAQQPKHAPRSGVSGRNLAYIDFTSGSTGKPKGVCTEQRGVLRTVKGTKYAHLGPEETLLLIAPVSFDASTLEVWGSLLNGARLVVYPPGPVGDVEELKRVVKGKGVTTLHLTAGLFAQVVDADVDVLRGLKQLLTGGDVVSAPHVRRVVEELKVPVTACYGPTENTLFTSCHRMTEGSQVGEVVAIGQPIGNTRVYVLDAALNPVPVGVAGELYAAGEGVARGYLGSAELTAERFVPDLHSGLSGERMYRTGDLARWRADGTLEFLGRADTQVKVRGFRIELGEVEGALRAHPAVKEAVVVAKGQGAGDKRLVAYVVGHGPELLDVGELRRALQSRVPEYMVPAIFVPLEALPLTSNGKVDRKTLPEPEGVRPELARQYVAPRTEVEKTLAEVWAQVLGLDRVGVQDNFFELGGDSILSLQVVSRAKRTGLEVTPKQLFQKQTVEALAQVVKAAQVVAAQGPVEGPVELTPVQQAFFAQERRQPHHFNQSLLLEVARALDAAVLEKALNEVVKHHDALRMRFEQADGEWKQRNAGVDEAGALKLEQVDLRGAQDVAAQLEQVATQVQGSLDLEKGPLVKAVLFELGEKGRRLLVVVHHLVVDGVSWRVVVEDVERACEQVELGPKSASYQQWARRLKEYAGQVEGEVAYWEAQGAAQVSSLPVDEAGGRNETGLEGEVRLELSREETAALLREVPGAYRARVDEVLLAGLAAALKKWRGLERVRVELEGHGREEEVGLEVSRTVGWFTSVYPVVVEAPKAEGAGAWVRAVKESVRRVPGKGLGFGLLKYLGAEESRRKLAALPKAEVVFNYLGQVDATAAQSKYFAPAKEKAGEAQAKGEKRAHVLGVNGLVVGGRLEVAIDYGRELHRRESVEELARHYAQELRQLLRQRTESEAGLWTPVDFPLVKASPPQLEKVLGRGEGVEDVYPLSPLQQGLLFHSLLEAGSGVYVEQLTWEVRGGLDVSAFRKAWETVVERLSILRTRFLWEGLEDPLQVVQRTVQLPWEERDWSSLGREQQRSSLDEYLKADSRRGFELGHAPLMRMAVMKLGEDGWRCVWSHHHLLLDGWSLGLVLEELFATYESLVTGAQARSSARSAYREYIAWLGKQDTKTAEAYWREALKGVSASTRLPLEARGSKSIKGQQELHVQLTEEESSAVQGFAQRQQVTVNTLAQGAWALVLGRHAGEGEVVFGATVAGRPTELDGVEGMVGLFINTLPVRVKLPGDEVVAEWLKGLQKQQAEQRQFEHSALVQVQGWTDVPRRQPLFESLLVFENYPIDDSLKRRTAQLDVRDVWLGERTNYPLTLSVIPGSKLRLRLAYETSRFEQRGMDALLSQWKVALLGLVTSASKRLEAAPLLTETERQQVLKGWNATAQEYARESSIAEEFERQVAQRPDAVAVECGEEKLTYRQLDERANQLAHLLRSKGVGAEERVGLCLERSVELVVALVGIAKSGGAYVPLEADYPQARLEQMVSEVRPRVVVTRRALAEKLPVQGVECVLLEEMAETLAQQPKHAPRSGVSGRNLAYIDFTSGSTGKPKGVCTEQRGVLRTVKGTKYAHLGPEETLLLIAPVSFDASTLEVWGSLLNGARLVVYPPGPVGDVEELKRVVKGKGVTTLHLTAGLFAQVVDADVEVLRGLKQLLTGGDVVSAPHVRRVVEELKVPVTACYGPTENTLFTSCHRMTEGSQVGEVVAIGQPIGNTRVYVLDAALSPVPVGVAGELYAAGEGVARGYLGSAELTAERFIPDVHGGVAGERMYRTGDLARWRADGTLEFLGRADTQVKVRGFRIELGEVEGALRAHPAVKEAVVVAKGQGAGDKRLVAYVVGHGPDSLDVGELRRALKSRLPEYMVPSAFVPLEALPLTSNGKVDRKALPDVSGARPASEHPYVEPRSDVEQKLALILAEILGVARVGIHDDFFELGGHSLLATRTISRIRSELGVELPLSALFENPSIARLSVHLVQAQSTQADQAELEQLLALLEQDTSDDIDALLASGQLASGEE